jgi:hypothetical protein
MELIMPGLDQRQEKIESSAEALWMCHHPILFPSSQSIRQQCCAGNRADKDAKNGKFMSLRVIVLPCTCTQGKCDGAAISSHYQTGDCLPKARFAVVALLLAMTSKNIKPGGSLCVESLDISGRVTRRRSFSMA